MTLQYVCNKCSFVATDKRQMVTLRVWSGIGSLSKGNKSIKNFHLCLKCYSGLGLR